MRQVFVHRLVLPPGVRKVSRELLQEMMSKEVEFLNEAFETVVEEIEGVPLLEGMKPSTRTTLLVKYTVKGQ